MYALILSNLNASDEETKLIINNLKSFEKYMDSICFVVDNSHDINITKLLNFIDKPIIPIHVVKVKKASTESEIIKIGVRFLKSFTDFHYFFYSNTSINVPVFLETLQKLETKLLNNKNLGKCAFSNRYRNYKNVYNLKDFIN